MTLAHELWKQAMDEHPSDSDARRERWFELLCDAQILARPDGTVPLHRRPLSDQCQFWSAKLSELGERLEGIDKAIVLGMALTLDRWAADELAE